MKAIMPGRIQVERRPLEVRTPGPRLDGVRHIAVAREDRLGDFVLALPAIASIGATYPGARLSLIVDRSVAPLAELVRGTTNVISTDGRTGVGELASRLERAGVDTLIAISRRARSPLAAFRARLDRRVGSGGRWWSPLLTRKVVESRRGGRRHELEYALSFAHRVGAAPAEPIFPLELPPGVRDEARAWCERHGIAGRFVVLHPGSGGSCPAWPVRHFAALAARLAADGVAVVLSIGPADASCAEAFAGTIPTFHAGLPPLAALLASATLVISNSTGPLHLAAALATPTLAIHAPWSSCNAERWGPYGANGWAVVAEAPQAREWTRRERRRHGPALLAELKPALVYEHVRDLLGRP